MGLWSWEPRNSTSIMLHPFYHLHPQAHGSTSAGHLQILTFRHLCSSVLHVHLLGSCRCSCAQPWFPCAGTLPSRPAFPGSDCRLCVFTCPLPPQALHAVLRARGPASLHSLLCVCARVRGGGPLESTWLSERQWGSFVQDFSESLVTYALGLCRLLEDFLHFCDHHR